MHAKGAGAHGYFEVTHDVSDLTDADFLNGIGKKSEVLCRIATTGPEKGSADTVRDFRGFAIKIKTGSGNQDFVMNNQVGNGFMEVARYICLYAIKPVFFVREPVKFPVNLK